MINLLALASLVLLGLLIRHKLFRTIGIFEGILTGISASLITIVLGLSLINVIYNIRPSNIIIASLSTVYCTLIILFSFLPERVRKIKKILIKIIKNAQSFFSAMFRKKS